MWSYLVDCLVFYAVFFVKFIFVTCYGHNMVINEAFFVL